MTNTISNVPRELLEEVMLAAQRMPVRGPSIRAKLHAILSAPSPAGLDGLDTDRNAAFKACPESGCDWGSFYLGWKARGEVEQAIIDGLRGEFGAQRVKTCIALKERNEAREERDQQARRIGELAELAAQASVNCKNTAYYLRKYRPDLADICSGWCVAIDAALSAGKEGE